MNKKVLEIKLKKGATIDDVYQELLFYKEIGQIAICKVQGKILDNKNIDKLKEDIEKIKLGMTDEEYNAYKKNQNEELRIKKIVSGRSKTPSIVRYWIERAKTVINENKWNEWENYCSLLIENKSTSKEEIHYFNTIISAVKIMLVLNSTVDETQIYSVIDKEFSHAEYEAELLNKRYYYIADMISRFTDKGDVFKKLTYHDIVVENSEAFVKRRKIKR